MNIKAQIPNMFTMLNLFSGCVALVFVAEFNFELAFYFVCLGIFFDFFDGFFARKFDVAGPLGVQLDSLADMVTSGVVPGFVMFQMMRDNDSFGALSLFPYFGFVITLGACYRLAKFNIDTRQSDSFIGLPTPANALFITSLPLVFKNYTNNSIVELLHNEWFLLMITFISAYIMNAEIPLFSLKIKNFSVAKYKFQLFFLLFSVLLLVFLQILAVPLIIISYVLLSVVNNLISKESK
ncbi:MAG: CDP-alcohol phosphatidyltransferase family protein [Flavobacterium sp.]|uniref:CDP-alcohol phosphatidyltransferase family protein n=1 Tax=Flavobacterium sp. TaxID=239 RepID=UPI00352809E2